MSKLAPSPFKQDEWVQYTRHQTNAVTIAVVGVSALAMAGALWENHEFLAFNLAFTAVWFGPRAMDFWERAKRVRRSAEIRLASESAFVTVFAATILKTLQALEKQGKEASDE